ncbi:hypothetical protein HX126_16280 [Chryseobacterium indologenes]|uniref:DUF6520 family protein n=1 Tax=Chryseobacterium indologenes TaxID=253 RepID=UPI002576A63A|nr:DUF6520 family protein [Chryseobacterium indologenes]MDM1556124.1 hypothetical protein [Chryseobacterium indologenes]
MKNFRKIALPVAILLMGAGSAYATTAFKSVKTDFQGYRFDPSAPVGQRCVLTEKMCTDIQGEVCTYSDASGTHNLSKNIDGTSCGDQLFEIE